ncbi:MAG: PQQ-binding-like beta-propeller repeat protein [Acidobacteriota bacterium]|nr:PQQ-binding-like beta-propeller repeat protein [Acidobacteriota bacterium]
MKRPAIFWLVSALTTASVVSGQAARNGIDWPSYRGIEAAGIAAGFEAPTEWDLESGSNVRWQADVEGLAHSSPVIWGDSLFVTSAVASAGAADLKVGLYGDIDSADDDGEQRCELHHFDKRTGELRWPREVFEGPPRTRRHTKSTHANPTPATDGKRIIASFGSEGLYACDYEGNRLWHRDLGVLDSGYYIAPGAQWGFASSPVLYDGKVVVQCDIQKGSFLAVLDASTGAEVWRAARDELPTWSTPTVHAPDGGAPLIFVNGYRHIGAYDFASGGEVWKLKGGGDIPVPTPVVAKDLVYVTNAHGRMAPVYAVRVGAKGDISLETDQTSNSGVAWSTKRDGGYMQTPLVYGDELYVCRDNGVLSCFDAATGELHYKTRLGQGRTGFSSSGVAADGKIYFTSEEGEVYVIAAGTEFRQLAVNDLGEVHMSTPAISEGVLYFRTRGRVIAVGASAGPKREG